MTTSRGIRVQRSRGEDFRKALVELGAFDRGRRIGSDRSYVYLPVLDLDEKVKGRLEEVGEFLQVEFEFRESEKRVTAEELLGHKPHFEMVGDIAIVDPEEADEVASALMKVHKNIKTVIAPVGPVEGEFRTRRFRHIAGTRKTATLHKEHGLVYEVDLERAYFTPRLGTERLRVARQVRPGQMVLDMFAGVGPFALLMAKRGARVVAVDKNPVAVRYMEKNAALNRIEGIEILEGDATRIARLYRNQADHVIMNLPHSAHLFLEPAIEAAKNGGTVHYYSISPEEDLWRDTTFIEDAAQSLAVDWDILYKGVVRSYAPRQHNVVIEFRLYRP